MLGNGNRGLTEIHLERIQVTDLGLSAISKCSNLEVLHIVKAPECSNFGLICVAENCKLLRKLHIDGWRTNRIGDEGLIAIATDCPNIQELVLIGVNPTSLSLTAIASNCKRLERGARFRMLGSKRLLGVAPIWPRLRSRSAKGVSGEVAEWLRERRGSLTVNWDSGEIATLDAPGGVESSMEFPLDHVAVSIAPSSSTNPLTLFRTKFGFFSGRSFVPCTFRRWSVSENSSNGNL
ncbi:hypothetical protein M0R45_004558 [Rubus argutus]|uniref:Uncharacterized protein n=1 Tax=Rubus argutus TaxID=59490 RepID=A0AAW1YK34_RUBAR